MKKLMLLAMLLVCVALSAQAGWVINSNSQTLSRFDLTNQTLNNNFASLGQAPNSAPNKMVEYDGNLLVVVTYENTVQVVPISGGASQYIPLPDSSSPNDIIVDGDTAYVSGNDSDVIYRIDLSTFTVNANVAVGRGPQGMCIVGGKLYVCNTGFNPADYSYAQGTVSVINLASFTVDTTINVATNPVNIEFNNNTLYVVSTGNYYDQTGKISLINPATQAVVNTIDVGNAPASLAIVDDTIYIANSYPAGVMGYHKQTLQQVFGFNNSPIAACNTLVSMHDMLIAIDAGDYINSSTVRFYNSSSLSLLYEIQVGVGATDALVTMSTLVSDHTAQAVRASILAWPNPSSGAVRFASQTGSRQANQDVTIYNLAGQKVAVSRQGAWDGNDSNGHAVAAGIYLYIGKQGKQTVQGKLTIFK